MSDTAKWIDLSFYNLRVVPVKLALNKMVIMLITNDNEVINKNEAALQSLGFVSTPSGVRATTKFTHPETGALNGLNQFLEVFPHARLREMDFEVILGTRNEEVKPSSFIENLQEDQQPEPTINNDEQTLKPIRDPDHDGLFFTGRSDIVVNEQRYTYYGLNAATLAIYKNNKDEYILADNDEIIHTDQVLDESYGKNPSYGLAPFTAVLNNIRIDAFVLPNTEKRLYKSVLINGDGEEIDIGFKNSRLQAFSAAFQYAEDVNTQIILREHRQLITKLKIDDKFNDANHEQVIPAQMNKATVEIDQSRIAPDDTNQDQPSEVSSIRQIDSTTTKPEHVDNKRMLFINFDDDFIFRGVNSEGMGIYQEDVKNSKDFVLYDPTREAFIRSVVYDLGVNDDACHVVVDNIVIETDDSIEPPIYSANTILDGVLGRVYTSTNLYEAINATLNSPATEFNKNNTKSINRAILNDADRSALVNDFTERLYLEETIGDKKLKGVNRYGEGVYLDINQVTHIYHVNEKYFVSKVALGLSDSGLNVNDSMTMDNESLIVADNILIAIDRSQSPVEYSATAVINGKYSEAMASYNQEEAINQVLNSLYEKAETIDLNKDKPLSQRTTNQSPVKQKVPATNDISNSDDDVTEIFNSIPPIGEYSPPTPGSDIAPLVDDSQRENELQSDNEDPKRTDARMLVLIDKINFKLPNYTHEKAYIITDYDITQPELNDLPMEIGFINGKINSISLLKWKTDDFEITTRFNFNQYGLISGEEQTENGLTTVPIDAISTKFTELILESNISHEQVKSIEDVPDGLKAIYNRGSYTEPDNKNTINSNAESKSSRQKRRIRRDVGVADLFKKIKEANLILPKNEFCHAYILTDYDLNSGGIQPVELGFDEQHQLKYLTCYTWTGDAFEVDSNYDFDSDGKIEGGWFPYSGATSRKDALQIWRGQAQVLSSMVSSDQIKPAYELKNGLSGFYRDKLSAMGEQTIEEKEADIKSAIRLGLNKNGKEVFRYMDGARYINGNRSDNELFNSNDENHIQNAAEWLLGNDEAAIADCADAFVESVNLNNSDEKLDIEQFTRIVSDDFTSESEELNLRHFQEHIEAATVRYRVQQNQSQSEELSRSDFEKAIMVYNNQPVLKNRTSSSVINQQYSTPLPIASIADNLLGPKASYSSLLEPTIGNGSLTFGVIGSNVKIVGYDIDSARVENAKRLGIKEIENKNFLTVPPVGKDQRFDRIIANPPFGALERPFIYNDELKVNKIDHLICLKALENMSQDGKAVFIIGADSYIDSKAGMVTGSSQYFLNYIFDRFNVDIVEVSGDLYKNNGAGFPIRMLLIGQGKTERMDYERDKLTVLNSHEELWGWHESLAHQRYPEFAKKIEVITELNEKKARITEAPVNYSLLDTLEVNVESNRQEIIGHKDEIRAEEVNAFQHTYVPMSKLNPPSAMVPSNMSKAISILHTNFREKHGDVDDFVARELGFTKTHLRSVFSAEQVDSIGLAIGRAIEGKGFLIGDMTGLGKGRILAGLCWWSKLNGQQVMFVTEKSNLFTDLYRDLDDIGVADKLNYFILNNNESSDIRDQNNSIQVKRPSVAEQSRVVNSELLPKHYDIGMSTYSQFNRQGSKKGAWLINAVNGNNLLLDEAHNASGADSNTGVIFKRATQAANSVFFSTATFAKGAKNMGIYAPLFPDSVSPAEIGRALEKGGDVVLEITSELLSQTAMLARQHDMSALEFEESKNEQDFEKNVRFTNQMADILKAFGQFSGEVSTLVKEENKAIKKLNNMVLEEGGQLPKGSSTGLSSINFGSRLYQLGRQAELLMNVEMAIDEAEKAIKNNQRAFIPLENTMESLLKDFVEDETNIETGITFQNSGNRIPLSYTPDFKDVLRKSFKRMQVVNDRNGYGISDKKDIRDLIKADSVEEREMKLNALEENIEAINTMIDSLDDMPASPIDYMREELRKRGIIADEVSGRNLLMRRDNHDNWFIEDRGKPDRNKAIDGFNNGTTQVIFGSSAANSGLSLHSSNKFKNQEQRVLLELQILNQVDKRIQVFGRVNRKGQINAPQIKTINSGMPAVNRTLAMQNAKLAKLSANTTSSRENKAKSNVPDMLNEVGDKIAYQFLKDNFKASDTLTALGVAMPEKETDCSGLMRKITGYIGLFKYDDQVAIYQELSELYDAKMHEFEIAGVNPFKTHQFPYSVDTIKKEVYLKGDPVAKDGFNDDVNVITFEYEREFKPIRVSDIESRIESFWNVISQENHVIDRNTYYFNEAKKLKGRRDIMLDMAISNSNHEFESLSDALDEDSRPNAIKALSERFNKMIGFLESYMPGQIVMPQIDEKKKNFLVSNEQVIINLKAPTKPDKLHVPSAYRITVCEPGKEAIEMALSTLLSQSAELKSYTIEDPKAQFIRENFDLAKEGKIKVQQLGFGGNLFSAISKIEMGQPTIVKDNEDILHRVILLPVGFGEEFLNTNPIPICDSKIIKDFIEEFGQSLSEYAPQNNKKDILNAISLAQNKSGSFILQVPGTVSAGGHIFKDQALLKIICDEFKGDRTSMMVKFNEEKLKAVIDHLHDEHAVQFSLPGSSRKWYNEKMNTNPDISSKEQSIKPKKVAGLNL